MSRLDKKCTVVVSTCDAYSDTWAPFFTLLKKYWQDNPFEIVMNCETKTYENSPIEFKSFFCNEKNISWTKRLYKCIENINSEYILILLDDFFITDNVKTDKIFECINWMEENKKIANFTYYFTDIDGLACPYSGYELRPKAGNYKVNAVIGLWRKSRLLEYLSFDENPWQFEKFGNERSWLTDDEFYIQQSETELVFPYNFGEYGLFCGKWLKKTIDLFKENNIEIDFSIRGFYNPAHRALSGSIINVFSLESSIYPFYGFSKIGETNILCKTNSGVGEFYQEYKIDNAKKMVYWKLGIHWGFAIEKLKITIEFKDNKIETIDNFNGIGNYFKEGDKLLFLKPAPFIIVENLSNKKFKRIVFEGNIVFPLTEEIYDKYENIEPKNTLNLNVRFLLLEMQASQTHTNYFRVNSSCRQISSVAEECIEIKDNNQVRNGLVNQKYEISGEKVTGVEWKITNHNYFGIRDLEIYFIYDNNIVEANIKKHVSGGFLKFKSCMCFYASANTIYISFPTEIPNAIQIKANVIHPLPAKYLKKYSYSQKHIGIIFANKLVSFAKRFYYKHIGGSALYEFICNHTSLETRIKIGQFFSKFF